MNIGDVFLNISSRKLIMNKRKCTTLKNTNTHKALSFPLARPFHPPTLYHPPKFPLREQIKHIQSKESVEARNGWSSGITALLAWRLACRWYYESG